MDKKIPSSFFAEAISDPVEINPTLSKLRVKVFYKGVNRNNTMITDEFADALVETASYVPIKGIYENDDYSDHGEKRYDGKAYGVIPAKKDQNFAWEEHLDEDGIVRNYACFDVFIWTAVYEEAKKIKGKGQSMELFPPSIKGKWIDYEGVEVYKFEEGAFLGLQVLGDDVEPCFEGAAFYSMQELQDGFNKLFKLLEEQNKNLEKGGEQLVNKDLLKELVFKLSDEDKGTKILRALNPSGSYERYPVATYDSSVIFFDYGTQAYGKQLFIIEDEEVVLTGEPEEVFVEYVTKDEKSFLDKLKSIGEDSFEKTHERFEQLKAEKENLEVEKEGFELKKVEDAETIATLNLEKGNLETDLTNLTAEKEILEGELNELRAFKNKRVKEEKETIIASYSEKLSKESLDKIKEGLDNFTALELDKELLYLVKKENPEKLGEFQKGYIPKDEEPTGIEIALERARNKRLNKGGNV